MNIKQTVSSALVPFGLCPITACSSTDTLSATTTALASYPVGAPVVHQRHSYRAYWAVIVATIYYPCELK